jgi:acetyl-CoA C-acetyltransferase
MLTKPAAALWSTEPPTTGFQSADVSGEAERRTAIRTVDPAARGSATVAGYTVVYEGGEPARAVAVLDLVEGARTVATCADEGLVTRWTVDDSVGEKVTVVDPGTFG